MYITEKLITANMPIPDSYEVPEELQSTLQNLMPFVRLKFDCDGESKKLIGVEDDIEARTAYIAENTPTDTDILLYTQDDIRRERVKYLNAFDIYKNNVAYGIVSETEEEHNEIIEWYQKILDMPDSVSEGNTSYEFPDVPVKIDCYIIKKTKEQRFRDRKRMMNV